MQRTGSLLRSLIAVLAQLLSASLGFAQADFWQPTGLTDTTVTTLAINNDDHIFAGWVGLPGGPPLHPGALYRSTDNGENWVTVETDLTDNKILALAFNNSGHIFAGTFDGGVFRSTDNGEHWTAINSGLSAEHGHRTVRALTMNTNDHVFAGKLGAFETNVFDGVFRSTDHGENWSQINNGLTTLGIISLATNSSDHVFAVSGTGGVFRSTDNGENWSQVNNGLTSMSLNQVRINSNDDIFVTANSRGVFRSTDNGENWSQINNGLTHLAIRALAFNKEGDVFIGTVAGGVYRSTDNGESWHQINAGLTNTTVLALAVNSENTIFAGTDGSGVFRSTAPTTAVVELPKAIPASFVLEQNYPNPFNPSTTIQFAIAERSHVSLKLFDISGREVATLVEETLGPRVYEVDFVASDLPSGVYFYKIQTGDYVAVKKMVLMK